METMSESEILQTHNQMLQQEQKEDAFLQESFNTTDEGQLHHCAIEELESLGINYETFSKNHGLFCSGILTGHIVTICSDVKKGSHGESYYFLGGVDTSLSCSKCASTIHTLRCGNSVKVSQKLGLKHKNFKLKI
jgi:hypothetical protein